MGQVHGYQSKQKSTSSTTLTSILSATSVTTSVTTPTASSTTATTDNAIIINDPTSNDSSVTGASSILSDPVLLQSKNKAERETPAQNKIKKEIDVLKNRIVQLFQLKDSGLSNSDNVKQLEADRKSLKEKELKLKNLIADNVRQRKRRSEKSALIMELSSESEQARIKMQKFNHEASGRPSLELTHPGLLDAIIQIAIAGAGADERRRSNILTSWESLDGLLAGMKKLGFEDISRQSLYHRLVPRRADSVYGKRHVKTVPVKLAKAKNTTRNRHEDANFTFATKGYMKCIASHFGKDVVFAVSIDDKAKVPIGITAAKLQAPLVMHMEHQVRLPDHNFVKGVKHLIPSVYAACQIKVPATKKDPEISYSSPRYICIRSLKHDSSTGIILFSMLNTILNTCIFTTSTFQKRLIALLENSSKTFVSFLFKICLKIFISHVDLLRIIFRYSFL